MSDKINDLIKKYKEELPLQVNCSTEAKEKGESLLFALCVSNCNHIQRSIDVLEAVNGEIEYIKKNVEIFNKAIMETDKFLNKQSPIDKDSIDKKQTLENDLFDFLIWLNNNNYVKDYEFSFQKVIEKYLKQKK